MNRNVDRALSGGEKTGDILKYFDGLDDILEANSGINDNKTLTSDASDPPCPCDNNTYTKVKITDDAIDITNIDKSSITARVKIHVNFPVDFWTDVLKNEKNPELNLTGSETDEEKEKKIKELNDDLKSLAIARSYRNRFTKWFIGLKAGIHIFDAYRIYSYNKKTNCEQTEALYENAVVRMLKPQEELDEKPKIYTLWRRANAGDNCVCGTYFTLQDIIDSGSKKGMDLEFEVCVPLDDFLPLSAFTMYPNKVFENLSLELKMCIQQNFVVCQVDPKTEFEKLMKMDLNCSGRAIEACWNQLQIDVPEYTRHFSQTADEFHSCIYTIGESGQSVEFTSHKLVSKVTISNGKFMQLRSHLNGFNVKDSVLRKLREKYEETPLIIPAQYCDYQAFSQKPMASGLKCNTTYGMTNVSSLIFLFPRTHNQLTCCQNPHLDSVQVQIDNKPFPDKPFSTTEAAHSMFNLTNAGLDSLFSPSEEYSYSLNFKELDVKHPVSYTGYSSDGTLNTNSEVIEGEEEMLVVAPYKDNTSYCLVCATERLSGYGTYCDGLTKDNAHITLTGTCEGDPNHNPYLTNPMKQPIPAGTRNNNYNDRSPVMVVCQDCFWVFRTDRTAEFINNSKYFYEEYSEGIANDGDFDEDEYRDYRQRERRMERESHRRSDARSRNRRK